VKRCSFALRTREKSAAAKPVSSWARRSAREAETFGATVVTGRMEGDGKFDVDFPMGAERANEPLEPSAPANQNQRTAPRLVEVADNERLKPGAGDAGDLDWADRAGMVAQQQAAMEWVEDSHQARLEAAAQPHPTRPDLAREDPAPDPLEDIQARTEQTGARVEKMAKLREKDPELAAFLQQQAAQREQLEKDDDLGMDL
jgi:hypothetical protein